MAEAIVRRPHCQSEAVVKYGKTSNGKERFRCPQGEGCGPALGVSFWRATGAEFWLPLMRAMLAEASEGVGQVKAFRRRPAIKLTSTVARPISPAPWRNARFGPRRCP